MDIERVAALPPATIMTDKGLVLDGQSHRPIVLKKSVVRLIEFFNCRNQINRLF